MKVALHALAARHPAARAVMPPALGPMSLTIESGEHVAIIGPSGAGKTTLLHAAACALVPTQGQLEIDGVDPWALSRTALQRLRGRLVLAPQVPPLPPRQRVVTSVLAAKLPGQGLMASLASLMYPSDIPGAYAALDRFDMADKLFDRVDRLSGGERQRVGLSRALMAPATLWLVDEPLSALDPTRAQQAIATLVDAAREGARTLVVTLHQVEVALARFPRIVGLRQGQLAFDLPVADVTPDHLQRLYAQHESELFSAAPVVDETAPAAPAPAVMHCR